jgi:hypothetical protein
MNVPAATNTRRNISGLVLFYAICGVSKEILWMYLYIPPSLLRNVSIKPFPQQLRTAGSVVFCDVCVAWKDSKRSALPRKSCLEIQKRAEENEGVPWSLI